MAIKRLSSADRVKFDEQNAVLDKQVRFGELKTVAQQMREQDRNRHRDGFQGGEYQSRLDAQRKLAAKEAATTSPDAETGYACGACGESLMESGVSPDRTQAMCAGCSQMNDMPVDGNPAAGAAPPEMDETELDESGLGDADSLSNAPPPHALGTIKCPSCSHQFQAASSDGHSMSSKCARCHGPLSYRDLTLSKAAARRLVDQQAAHTARRRTGRERPLYGGDGEPTL